MQGSRILDCKSGKTFHKTVQISTNHKSGKSLYKQLNFGQNSVLSKVLIYGKKSHSTHG